MARLNYLLLTLFFYGCEYNANNVTMEPVNVKSVKNDSIKSFFKDEADMFDLEIKDSVKLVFTKVRSFDTSFILAINKKGNQVSGKFYYYPPTYYKGFPEFESTSVFLYKAINFRLTVAEWELIEKRIESLNGGIKKSSNNFFTSVIHPPLYKLFYNSILISNKDYENNYFNEIHLVINSTILNKLFYYYPQINGHIP